MKRSTTLILLVLTLGLGAWMMLRGDKGADLNGHLLFDWSGSVLTREEVRVDVNAADVAGMDLKSSSVEVSLRKGPDGTWDLTSGVVDRADGKFVKELLSFCSTARIAETIAGDEVKDGKVSAASLGLDDAGAWRVSWLKADGTALATMRVGKTAPLGSAGYVQIAGQDSRPDVYLVTPDLRPLLARPLDSFRDPRVSRYHEEHIARLVVRKGEGEVELSRSFVPVKKPAVPDGKERLVQEWEPTPWVISRPLPNAPAYQEAVKEFTAKICGAEVKGWLPYVETTDKPVVELTLVPPGEGAKGVALAFYNDPDAPEKTAICRDSQRKVRFKVDREVVDTLCIAESPNPFRSTKLAAVDPAIISTVQVSTTLGESVLICRVRDRWSWRPLAGGEWQDAAPERLERLITLLNETEILDFASDSLSDPAAYALDQPAITVTMAAGAHLSLEQLTPMTEKSSQALRIGIRKDGRIFANFSGDPFVYQIGPELPSGIPQTGLKWRSLTLPGFALLQVLGLKQIVGTEPPVELKHNSGSSTWTGTRGGADISGQIDTAAAQHLATRAGSLSVEAWQDNSADVLKALERPTVTVEIHYKAYDDKSSAEHIATATLELAPMPAGANAPLCYGRLSGVPAPFLLSSRLLREFSASLLRK